MAKTTLITAPVGENAGYVERNACEPFVGGLYISRGLEARSLATEQRSEDTAEARKVAEKKLSSGV